MFCKPREVLGRVIDPLLRRKRVGTEGFQIAFLRVVKERAMQTERARLWAVDQTGGIVGAHLEKHPHLKFGQRFPAQEAIHIVVCVAGRDHMETKPRPFGNEVVEKRGGVCKTFRNAVRPADRVMRAGQATCLYDRSSIAR